jgi:hypothetical protein
MRKNARYREGYEHCRDEHHPIEYGSRSELSSAGTTAEYVKPANDGYRHTSHTEDRTLVSDEWPIHEDRLHRTGPNNEHGSDRKIHITIHHRVFRFGG